VLVVLIVADADWADGLKAKQNALPPAIDARRRRNPARWDRRERMVCTVT
jgi:hypothetical protein